MNGDVTDLHVSDVDDDEDALPVYLWRPGQCNDKMADWEKHTRVREINLWEFVIEDVTFIFYV